MLIASPRLRTLPRGVDERKASVDHRMLQEWRLVEGASDSGRAASSSADEYEWTNLADRDPHAMVKADLKKHLPQSEKPSKK
jgi:hypothetical protein